MVTSGQYLSDRDVVAVCLGKGRQGSEMASHSAVYL
jgi:hypothetical protein